MIKRIDKNKEDKNVLVGVLKNKHDLNLLLKENWYQIPIKHFPKKSFSYLAFYQSTIFGKEGKCIKYYARVLNSQTEKRLNLLPDELNHPRSGDNYLKIYVGEIKELIKPIKNIIPRRICFGFTTFKRLLKANNILELYNITPTEQIIERTLNLAGIKTITQYPVSINKKRFRLDLAIFCQKGKIAIECDNKKAHTSPAQKNKDKIKDTFLKQDGWTVVRLSEEKIVSNLPFCLACIKKAIKNHSYGVQSPKRQENLSTLTNV